MSRVVDPTFKHADDDGAGTGRQLSAAAFAGLLLQRYFLRQHFLRSRTRARFPSATTTMWRSMARASAMSSARPASWRRKSCARRRQPNIATDLYSLAVILFYMFMVHHPLEGRREREITCLDLAAMKKLYGTEALFIFDPEARREPAGARRAQQRDAVLESVPRLCARDFHARVHGGPARSRRARARERMARRLHPDARPDLLLPPLRRGKFPVR